MTCASLAEIGFHRTAAAEVVGANGRQSRRAREAHLSAQERIQHEFHSLQLDPEGVRSLVKDYTEYRGEIHRFSRPKDHLFARYLLSTDSLRNRADEPRPVRYVLVYDPCVSPCCMESVRAGELRCTWSCRYLSHQIR